MNIRAAKPEEANHLSQLALRSKGYWGYDTDFLEACRTQLTICAKDIAHYPVFVLEEERIIGFYSLNGQGTKAELTNFFLEPDVIGCGYGKQLWQHAVLTAQSLGFKQLLIESDPYAEKFYQKMGAQRIGEVASSVQPVRMLPLLLFELNDPSHRENCSRTGSRG